MYSKNIELEIDEEGRNKAGAFRIKRSKTKRYKNKAESLLNYTKDEHSGKIVVSSQHKADHI